jgi:hypothetical protein
MFGNYWNKMQILRKHKEKNNQLFISTNKPPFFVKKDYILKTSSKHCFTDDELKIISDFYRRKYRVNKSTVTQNVTVSDLKRYLFLGCELLTIYKDEIIGSIISIFLPIYIKTEIPNKSLYFPCTSFLIVDDKYRGKGYGMSLIQEGSLVIYELGYLGAFFINNISRCDNSINLYTWYYPLNFNKLDVCKFIYPKDYKHCFQVKYEKEIKRVDENNLELAYNFYTNYLKDKIFYFSPNLSYWKKWIICFPTYLIFDADQIIGLFSYDASLLKFPSYQDYLFKGSLMICIGKQPDVLNASISQARNMFDILNIFETGDINIQLLKSVFAQSLNKSHINFYNTRLKIKAEDFYAPIF